MSAQKTQGRIFWGLLLIVLGVLFLFDQMDKLDFGDLVGRYWPVVFILIGISILLSNNFQNVGSGIFFILFGAFFLLDPAEDLRPDGLALHLAPGHHRGRALDPLPPGLASRTKKKSLK